MSDVEAFAGSVPANYDKLMGPYLFEPYALDLKERLKDDNCKDILELACGTGRVTNHLVTVLPDNGHLVATDINIEMINVARAKVKDERVEWRVADAQQLPFADQSFDHVICQFGVMFFPGKVRAFEEARRVLKPKGKFIFSTWGSVEDNRQAAILKEVFEEVFEGETASFFQNGPYSFYDTDVIQQLVAKAGFKNVNIEAVHKSGNFKSREEYVDSFIDGSPLSAYIESKGPTYKEVVRKKIDEALEKETSDFLRADMLAFVVTCVND